MTNQGAVSCRRMTRLSMTRRVLAIAALLPTFWLSAAALDAHARGSQQSRTRWYKGNTHTHTLNSDGDTAPDEVARWYRERGYHFLVLSDHNYLTSVAGLNALMGADERFLLIPGEEVTDRFETKPIHINGLNVDTLVAPQGGRSVVETVQRNVDAIRAARGVPHINHPNFGWAISADELAQVRNNRLFEIFNGHPMVNNAGGGGVPGLEQVWDSLLTRGLQLYGLAVDDAHHFKEFSRDHANPGRGWVSIRADRLEPLELLRNLEAGRFYASSGVELEDVRLTPTTLEVRVRPRGDFKYTTQFVGTGGRLLLETIANPAVFTLSTRERYVRARVRDSGGGMAWVQPVFVEGAGTERD